MRLGKGGLTFSSVVGWGGQNEKTRVSFEALKVVGAERCPPTGGYGAQPLHNITVSNVGVGGETGEAWGARVSKLSEFSGCQG